MPLPFRWRDKPTPERRRLNSQFMYFVIVMAAVWVMSYLARIAGR